MTSFSCSVNRIFWENLNKRLNEYRSAIGIYIYRAIALIEVEENNV
jgi:hypothetical protein